MSLVAASAMPLMNPPSLLGAVTSELQPDTGHGTTPAYCTDGETEAPEKGKSL